MANNFYLYLTTVLIWGSTWIFINFQLGVVEPEVSIVYRHAIASLILFGWAFVRGLRLRFGIHAHGRFMLLGLFLFSFNYIVTYSAQQYIPSALNAVVCTTIMWMNVLNARLFFKIRIESRVYMGAGLGILGVSVMFWPSISAIDLSDRTLFGAGLSLCGAVLTSWGNMVSHQAQSEQLPIVQSTAWSLLYGMVITAAVAIARGIPFNFEMTFEYVGSLLYLAVFGTILAFGSYLKLLGRIGPHKAAYASVTFPVIAVLLSVLFEGLAIEWHLVLGITLVLAGNLAVLGLRRTLSGVLRAFGKTAT